MGSSASNLSSVDGHRCSAGPAQQTLPSLLLLWLIFAIAWFPAPALPTHGEPDQPRPSVRDTIDPNLAPWPELATLPRIGESKARAIVGYRKSMAADEPPGEVQPAFKRPSDLERVRGIGPKTVLRVSRYLRFDGE